MSYAKRSTLLLAFLICFSSQESRPITVARGIGTLFVVYIGLAFFTNLRGYVPIDKRKETTNWVLYNPITDYIFGYPEITRKYHITSYEYDDRGNVMKKTKKPAEETLQESEGFVGTHIMQNFVAPLNRTFATMKDMIPFADSYSKLLTVVNTIFDLNKKP